MTPCEEHPRSRQSLVHGMLPRISRLVIQTMKHSILLRRLACVLMMCAMLLPSFSAYAANLPADPAIEATAALLVNGDTGMVLYENNADARKYPASITKVMTALVVLENIEDLNETVTAIEADFDDVTPDSSNADIKVGETMTVHDLLYCLMLPSANEAAYILARHVGGNYENFMEMMNAKAAALGCSDTHFVNPCGLHDDDHYTTARDIYLMCAAAMQDETFALIANTAVKTIAATSFHEERKVYTTNILTYSSSQPWFYAYCKGIKTGHTSQAGYCLAAYAEYKNANLYSVVLGCTESTDGTVEKSFTETKRLFEWGFENFEAKTLVAKGDSVAEINVRLSADVDKLVLTTRQDLIATIPTELEVSEMEVTKTIPESVDAPVQAGAVLGSVTYSYAGRDYATVELVALVDIERSDVLYYASLLEDFFHQPAFQFALLIFVIFLLLYVVFKVFAGRARRRKKRRTRSNPQNQSRRRRR